MEHGNTAEENKQIRKSDYTYPCPTCNYNIQKEKRMRSGCYFRRVWWGWGDVEEELSKASGPDACQASQPEEDKLPTGQAKPSK